MNKSPDSEALAAYVILARDVSDFVDYVETISNEGKDLLLKMLETPNKKHDAETRELNAFGASFLKKGM